MANYGYDGWSTQLDSQGSAPGYIGHENWNIWATLNASNGLTTRTLFGNSFDDPIARISPAADSPTAVAWYVADRQGSVIGMLDSSGNVAATMTYDGFGNQTSNSNPTFTDDYGFQGMRYESAINAYDDDARWLNMYLDRFDSPDPMGFAAGDENLYRFVGNGFVNENDPSGFWAPVVVPILVGTGEGAATGGAGTAIGLGLGGGTVGGLGLASGFPFRSARQIDNMSAEENLKWNQEIQNWVNSHNKPSPSPQPAPFTPTRPSLGTGTIMDVAASENGGNILQKLQKQQQQKNNGACFVAGTKLWTPQGFRNIEDIRPNDLVFSRSESDPNGAIQAKRVEERFTFVERVLHLHLSGGQVIGTTAEHPFFLENRGWTEAVELRKGDRIACSDGKWAEVSELVDTGRCETVYNLRVADFSTYFVGCEEWDFSVWAHNACIGVHDTSPKAAAQIISSGRVNSPAWVQPQGPRV